MTVIRCAHLDAQGVYQGMVEIEPAQLTDRHLPTITECDLPPGEYRWQAEPVSEANAFGGKFVPLKFDAIQAKLAAQAEREAAGGVKGAQLQRAVQAEVQRVLANMFKGA